MDGTQHGDSGSNSSSVRLQRVTIVSFPQRFFQILSNFKDLSPQERWAYFRLRVQSGAFRGRLCNPPLPRDPRSVLFVCQGNIIRSPFAAALFHRLLPSALQERIHVASAGLDTTPGKPADPRALQLAKEFDVPLDAHRTQRLTTSLVECADLIVVMDALKLAKFVPYRARGTDCSYSAHSPVS